MERSRNPSSPKIFRHLSALLPIVLCFCSSIRQQANSAAIAVSTKTSVHTQKSSNSSGKSYKNAFLLHCFTMQFCLDVIGMRVPRHLSICLHGHEFFINTRVVSTVNKTENPFSAAKDDQIDCLLRPVCSLIGFCLSKNVRDATKSSNKGRIF